MKIAHKISIRDDNEHLQLKAIEAAAFILEDLLRLKDRGLTLTCHRDAGWAGREAFGRASPAV